MSKDTQNATTNASTQNVTQNATANASTNASTNVATNASTNASAKAAAKEIPVRDEWLREAPVVEEKTFTCVVCPTSCTITVGLDETGEPVHVYGHTCKRGLAYATAEATHPERTVTAAIPVAGSLEPLSVKTSIPVPKPLIGEVLAAINAAAPQVKKPIKVGDVIVARVCQTEADIVATKNLL